MVSRSSILVLAALLTPVAASANKGVTAAQLDYVALDSSVECNRIMFRSSQHYKGTIFAIPRVVPGMGVESARIYNITPAAPAANGERRYNLAINLYFPASDEVLKSSAASSFKRDLLACNWDHVKDSINKNVKDKNQHITVISRIPLTSVEVKVQGISEVAEIGRTLSTSEEVDILDYYGKSLTAHFIITESEKRNFEANLTSSQGIAAGIKFRFQARNRDGSVTVKVNSSNLAKNFDLAAKAKGVKAMAPADISVAIKSAVSESSNSIEITSEAGATEVTATVQKLIIDKVMKEVESLFKPPEAPAADTKEAKKTDGEKVDDGKVAVSAVVEVIKRSFNTEFTYNSIATPEVATAQAPLRLWTDRINDPNVVELTLQAGGTDPSLGMELEAGKTLVVTPAQWYVDMIDYNEYQQFLTQSDIAALKLAPQFPRMMDPDVTIKNIKINDTLLAEGRYILLNGQGGPRPLIRYAVTMGETIYSPMRYRWQRKLLEPRRNRVESDLIPTNLKSISEHPIYITFSELGDNRMFSFKDLLTDNPFWNAFYDTLTGRVFITAKVNLGGLRFRQRMRGEDCIKFGAPIVLDQVEEQRTGLFREMKVTNRAIIKQDNKPIVKQKSVIVYVRRPDVIAPEILAEIKKKALEAQAVADREQGRAAAPAAAAAAPPVPGAMMDRPGEAARSTPRQKSAAPNPDSNDEFVTGFGQQGKP